MKQRDASLRLSATDLTSFFECSHKSSLALQVARGERQAPGRSEIERRMLALRGHEHEARVLEYYRARGSAPFEIRALATEAMAPAAVAQTLEAMQRGESVIYQAVLAKDDLLGRPDFLIKVARPSNLGDYAYEPLDAKLARTEKAAALLQLCTYAELLEAVQGVLPEHLWLALGAKRVEPQSIRTADCFAYYRHSSSLFREFLAADAQSYPEPCEHCDVCEWWRDCEKRRKDDDHLSLVAGITRRQRLRLRAQGVEQLVQLAKLPKNRTIEGIDASVLDKIRWQASLQHEGRSTGRPCHELILDGDPGTGLQLLPEPKPGDLFLDLEGDAFFANEGLEYLFGLVELGSVGDAGWGDLRTEPGAPTYHAFWATTVDEEKRAFEKLVRRIERGLEEFPDLHVYHFGRRENDALKRLACKHGVGEDLVDHLLRNDLLVDLHSVVRHGLRASVESYSLKELEPLYDFARKTEVRAAARAMQYFGWWLETRDPEIPLLELRDTLAKYNEEDCLSVWKLRDWLEGLRLELQRRLERPLARPTPKQETASADLREREKEVRDLTRQLVGELPPEVNDEPITYKARRLLANLLDWHRRESKAEWWQYYEAAAVAPNEWLDSRLLLAGLAYEGVVGEVKKSNIHRYRFPTQEHPASGARTLIVAGPHPSSVSIAQVGSHFIDVKRAKTWQGEHPKALRPQGPVNTQEQERQLLNVARSIAQSGFDDRSTHAAARDLLLRAAPRVGQREGANLMADDEEPVSAVKRLCLALAGSVLAVQGPPGSGKSHCAAHAIVELVRAGRKVGITANGHQVIVELLKRVCDLAAASGVELRAEHLGEEDRFDAADLPFPVNGKKDYADVGRRLASGELHVVGGTTWAWTNKHLDASLDVLFVDEAGQMSLANALAVSTAAQNLVLLGDPAQLEQPQKGVHPGGAEVSALQHLVGPGRSTIASDLGVFLPLTRRLHPAVCEFTSEVFYEGRLCALPGLERQRINGPAPFDGAGLRFVPVEHAGNSNRSDEEVEAISAIVERLFEAGTTFTDKDGIVRPLGAGGRDKDVLVVAPYNSQVAALKQRLPLDRVEVGTVDKFQGKEAPIVIYSLTTSTGDEAPRGLEFLYSLNRLNVATSRAKALVVLVASPELAKAKSKTPRQMRLVNALCDYLQRTQPRNPASR